MKIRDMIIGEIQHLSHEDLARLYSLILDLKAREAGKAANGEIAHYIRVRQALAGITESLSEDISRQRNDRI